MLPNLKNAFPNQGAGFVRNQYQEAFPDRPIGAPIQPGALAQTFPNQGQGFIANQFPNFAQAVQQNGNMPDTWRQPFQAAAARPGIGPLDSLRFLAHRPGNPGGVYRQALIQALNGGGAGGLAGAGNASAVVR